MRVLVTGGAGFIGANLCAALLDMGAGVVVLDDLSTGSESNLSTLSGSISLEVGTILDSDVCDRLVKNVDAVVHLAARPSVARSVADPIQSHRVNVEGTLTVLEAVRAQSAPPHLVFASSSSVYGANPLLPKSESMCTWPRSPYAASKLAGEAYVLGYAGSYGLESIAFRFFNVFGPLQRAGHAYAAVIPSFLDALLHSRELEVQGDGTQTRDFTYVGSVTSVIAAAVERRVFSDRPVNLAFGSRVSLLELVSELEALVGAQIPVSFGAPRPGDVKDSQADTSLLNSLFPDAKAPGLAVCLRETLNWFESDLGLTYHSGVR